jgi:hypothetical protein
MSAGVSNTTLKPGTRDTNPFKSVCYPKGSSEQISVVTSLCVMVTASQGPEGQEWHLVDGYSEMNEAGQVKVSTGFCLPRSWRLSEASLEQTFSRNPDETGFLIQGISCSYSFKFKLTKMMSLYCHSKWHTLPNYSVIIPYFKILL